jgi:hypothetical protein
LINYWDTWWMYFSVFILMQKKKGKVIPLHAMEAHGGREVQLLLILNLGTRWGWVVSVTPWPRFTPGERTPSTHWIGGWVGPRAGLDAGARRKILCPCQGSNLDRPIVQPVVRHYTAWATVAPIYPSVQQQMWRMMVYGPCFYGNYESTASRSCHYKYLLCCVPLEAQDFAFCFWAADLWIMQFTTDWRMRVGYFNLLGWMESFCIFQMKSQSFF